MTVWRFGVLFMSEISCCTRVGKQNRNIVVGESRSLKVVGKFRARDSFASASPRSSRRTTERRCIAGGLTFKTPVPPKNLVPDDAPIGV